MKRTIRFWLYFICAIAFGVYFSVRIVMVLLGHGDIARIRNISVSADVSGKDLSAVVAAATVAPGAHSYATVLSDINARVSAVPDVRVSAVRRMPNGNLAVRVKLYRAVAQWTDGQNYYPLSADGTIVNRPTEERDMGAVLFRGDVPDDIVDITNAAHAMGENLDYLEWIERRRWNLYTHGGIMIMLPEENPSEAIGTIGVLNRDHNILSKKITVIDMRDSARILVR